MGTGFELGFEATCAWQFLGLTEGGSHAVLQPPLDGSAWEDTSIETQAMAPVGETGHGLLPHKFI